MTRSRVKLVSSVGLALAIPAAAIILYHHWMIARGAPRLAADGFSLALLALASWLVLAITCLTVLRRRKFLVVGLLTLIAAALEILLVPLWLQI
jgi:hypothetical protein